ncbi:MAG: hypothetical protein CML13_16110 [Puniceicoccaceae bacterium]|nr:hypothetical protein [Puniceicoccaceae bacterium]
MVKKKNMIALVAGSVFIASASHASINVTANVIGSDSGFGAIQYDAGNEEGDNVSEFVIHGRVDSAAAYNTSAGTLHISPGIASDGDIVYGNTYDATNFGWTGGSPTESGTAYNNTSVNAISSGYGTTAATWASLSVASPSEELQVSFFVHNYFISTDLSVLINGVELSYYEDVMSSDYNSSGGEGRDTDFFYDFNFSGLTAGDSLGFKFTSIANLGSDWANLSFLSSSLNYEVPTSMSNDFIELPNAIPEPATIILPLLVGCGVIFVRRPKLT